MLLNTVSKHHHLTLNEIVKEENLGMVPDEYQVRYLLRQLTINGFIKVLEGISPVTYMITAKGAEEQKRLAMI